MNRQGVHLKVALCALLMALSLPSTAQRTIDLQGHRGARGLLAENTLPSFALALQMGVTTLELDVVVTQDDVLVISHDPALNPDITRDAQGRFLGSKGPDIRQLTFEQLQSYDVGRINPTTRYSQIFPAQKGQDSVRIPRLKDLFDLVKTQGNTQVKFAIETKITPQRPDQTPDPERFVQLLLQEIKDHGMSERVQILSFDWRTLQAVQKTAPGMPTVYVTAQLPVLDNLGIKAGQPSTWTAGFQHAQHGSVPRMIKAAGGTHWSSFWRELDAQKVREAQSLGLKVLAWTVNDRQSMGQMLDLGVDGLVTDRPDIAAELLKERGIRWTTPR
jgi:glycerophosphoryl diester phosphodiesterase